MRWEKIIFDEKQRNRDPSRERRRGLRRRTKAATSSIKIADFRGRSTFRANFGSDRHNGGIRCRILPVGSRRLHHRQHAACSRSESEATTRASFSHGLLQSRGITATGSIGSHRGRSGELSRFLRTDEEARAAPDSGSFLGIRGLGGSGTTVLPSIQARIRLEGSRVLTAKGGLPAAGRRLRRALDEVRRQEETSQQAQQ